MKSNSTDHAFRIALAIPQGRISKLRAAVSDAISNGDDCVRFLQRVQRELVATEEVSRQRSRSDY